MQAQVLGVNYRKPGCLIAHTEVRLTTCAATATNLESSPSIGIMCG